MGIIERRQKHKDDLRQLILDAAKKLFLKEGYHGTSIRKIASAIEFSPTTIYLYYKDKAEIAHALHREGFKLLGYQFSLLQHIDDPFERLKAMGRIYIQFSIENTDFYELMFVLKEPIDHIRETGDDACWDEGNQAFGMLTNNIADCRQAGYFHGMETGNVAMVAWSTLHGLCTLHLHGHLEFIRTHAGELLKTEDLLESVFNTFVKMIERLK